MNVEVKRQPLGEAAARQSLREVAIRATRGARSPKVRSWALRKIKDAGAPDSPLDRAAALLAAMRAEFFYSPDPHHVEFIPDAELMIDGTFVGGDCDDLTTTMLACTLAALSSVGMKCAVVGHSYDDDRSIGHVLGGLYYRGEWYYADPSVKEERAAFGKPPQRPTRERILILPVPEGGEPQVICDAKACLRGPSPVAFPQLDQEAFLIGVNAPGEGNVGPDPALLGQAGQGAGVSGAPGVGDAMTEAKDAWQAYLSNLSADIAEGIDRVKALKLTVYELARSHGMKLPVSPIGKVDPALIDTEQDAMIDELLTLARQAVAWLDEAVRDERPIVKIEGSDDFGLGLLPGDTSKMVLPKGFRLFDPQELWQNMPLVSPVTRDEQEMVQAPGRPHGPRPPEASPEGVGIVFLPLIMAGASLVVLPIAAAFYFDLACVTVQKALQELARILVTRNVTDCIEKQKASGGDPKLCLEAIKEIDAGIVEGNKSLGEMNERVLKQSNDRLRMALWAAGLTAAAALSVLGYLEAKKAGWLKGKK